MSTLDSRTRHSWQHEPQERPAAPPPLEPGDRLTRAEFERRYAAMPHVKKAELIEGVVYILTGTLRSRQTPRHDNRLVSRLCGRCTHS